jgi:hypothetical protein
VEAIAGPALAALAVERQIMRTLIDRFIDIANVSPGATPSLTFLAVDTGLPMAVVAGREQRGT